jgi:MFS transporter, FHS family, glucose/mannose:H+ symporter
VGRWLLFAGFVVTGFVTTVLGPILPWLTARWHLTDAEAGALFTIQFTASVVAGLGSGVIVARLGASATLAAGYGMMACGFAGLAVGDRVIGTLAIALAGVGLGFVVPPTNFIVARLTPERAAAALGALNLCWGIGAAGWPAIVAQFNPTPGVAGALLVAAALLAGASMAMAFTPFPSHILHDATNRVAAAWTWRRLTIFAMCIALYSGVESAFGGWIAEYTRRLSVDATDMRWESAASAFWGGLAAGRGLVAIGLAPRYENVAVFSGLVVVAVAVGALLTVAGPSAVLLVAVACGFGLAPSFPVTMAALAREMPASIAQPMIALGSLGAAIVPWVVGAISTRTGMLASGLRTLLVLVAVLVGFHAARVRGAEGDV